MFRSKSLHTLLALCFTILSFTVVRAGDPRFNPRLPPPGPQLPPPGAAEIGEKLFFDPILSGSGRTACASCHLPEFGFSNGERTTLFDGGKIGPRKPPSLLTSAYFPRLMWDGRFGSLEDQLRGPMSPRGEMGSSIEAAVVRLSQNPAYANKFISVFGEPPTPINFSIAIASFERSLVSGWSPFDRFFLKGDQRALSPAAIAGYDIFTGKGRCVACHRLPENPKQGYPLFTDFGYNNIGIGFRGRFLDPGLARISGRKIDLGTFRTPSLRNVAVRGPYMHDGSLDTLWDVVEFYNRGAQPNPFFSPIIKPLGLSPPEKEALVAFLESLTIEELKPRTHLSRY